MPPGIKNPFGSQLQNAQTGLGTQGRATLSQLDPAELTKISTLVLQAAEGEDLSGVGQGNKFTGFELGAGLARAGAALLGPQSEVGALGTQVADYAEGEIASKAYGDIVSGKPLSEVNFQGLRPSQVKELVTLRKSAQNEKIDQLGKVVKVSKDLTDIGFTEQQTRGLLEQQGLLEIQKEGLEFENTNRQTPAQKEEAQLRIIEAEAEARKGINTASINQQHKNNLDLLRERIKVETPQGYGRYLEAFPELLDYLQANADPLIGKSLKELVTDFVRIRPDLAETLIPIIDRIPGADEVPSSKTKNTPDPVNKEIEDLIKQGRSGRSIPRAPKGRIVTP